jgi:hypothetical protein
MDYELIYLALRRSHIAVGIIGLVAFWIPIIAKKGGRTHVLSGRVFEWCGYYVATTALFTCARYLLTPHDFAFISRPNASPEELQRIAFVQFFLLVLGFLALNFLAQLRTGLRVVRTRQLPAEAYRNWEAAFWLYSQLAFSIGLMLYGANRLANGGSSYHWICVGVGAIPLFEFRQERRFFLNPREQKMSWWYKHMNCMCGCGVAFHTAGFVFTSRWLANNWDVSLPGMWQLVPWILPAALGVPLTHYYVTWYRKKFGDAKPSRVPNVATNVALEE